MTAASLGLVTSSNNAYSVDEGDPSCVAIDNLRMRCTRLRKNIGIAAKLLSQSSGRCWMLTLTYADAQGWKATHVRECLTRLRNWLSRSYKWRLRYLWVMETQKRKSGNQLGQVAPHYHLVVWVPHQVTLSDLSLDARGMWPHGLTNAVKAVAPVRYVMKYASKFDNAGAFPKGARIYGVGGLDSVGRGVRRWINWPSFVQGRASVTCKWRRATGGGWAAPDGGWWPSEFALLERTRSSATLLRVFNHPRLVEASGPFSWMPAHEPVAA